MHVWRLLRACYEPLSGEGARIHGGRWNPPGLAVIYTSESLALAALELLVHTPSDLLPADLTAAEIDIPDAEPIEMLRRPPRGWHDADGSAKSLAAGEEWLRSRRTLVLGVPSVIIPTGLNYLLNPAHPGMARVNLVGRSAFQLDPRFRAPDVRKEPAKRGKVGATAGDLLSLPR